MNTVDSYQGMKKSEQAKTSKREDGVDFISEMPDAILVLILSRLSFTQEQIRTSILSKRWMHLWTAVPSVNIMYIDRCYGGRFTHSEYKEFVYWVLVNKSIDFDSFHLYYSDDSMSTIWRWIHVAVKRNVKQLDVCFLPEEKAEEFELPQFLVNCASLEVLRLSMRHCELALPQVMGFPALRDLTLSDFDLLEDDDLVKDFFKSCPLLEELSLIDCILYKLDLLYISCPNLKRLTINNDNGEDMGCDNIKICCPKLEDLNLLAHKACNLCFESLPSLKQAVIEPISKGNTVPSLSRGNSHVKTLWMDLYFSCECMNAACDRALPNLKTLALKTTMEAFTVDELIRILKYCPKLENLKLTIFKGYYHENYMWLNEDETRMLLTPDVKRVEFFKFNGEKPKLDIRWCECDLEMFFTWGNKDRFSHW